MSVYTTELKQKTVMQVVISHWFTATYESLSLNGTKQQLSYVVTVSSLINAHAISETYRTFNWSGVRSRQRMRECCGRYGATRPRDREGSSRFPYTYVKHEFSVIDLVILQVNKMSSCWDCLLPCSYKLFVTV